MRGDTRIHLQDVAGQIKLNKRFFDFLGDLWLNLLMRPVNYVHSHRNPPTSPGNML